MIQESEELMVAKGKKK